MKGPELSLDQLVELQFPALDRHEPDIHTARRDPANVSFDWIHRIRAALNLSPPSAKRRGTGKARKRRVRLGPFEFQAVRDRVTVRFDGKERWVIDTKAFTGTALSLTVQNGVVEIALTDALYPGTMIPADLKARVWQEKGVWQIRIRLKFGGFDATLPLQDWLTGTQLATSDVSFDLNCLPLGATSALIGRGAGKAVFTPDFLLGVAGKDVFLVEGVQETVTADLGLVALLPSTAPQIVLPTAFRRTVIVLGSSEQFPVMPDFGAANPQFALDEFRFDNLAFEAGVDTQDEAWRVLIARSVADPTTLGLVPGGDLHATDGREFCVPLANPLYVILYDAARNVRGAGLIAQGPPQPIWMHCPTCSLLVRRSQTEPVIGLLALPGKDLFVNCRLRLEKVAFHLEGFLVTPSAVLRTEVLFTWKPLTTPLPPRTVHAEIEGPNGLATIRIPPGTTTAIVRRDDLLVLVFEFHQLFFAGRAGIGRFLHEVGQTPVLVVILPAQSIAEEAIFQADPSYPIDKSDADPAQNKKTGPDTPPNKLPVPPVKALLARPSRLAFSLPAGASPLSLSAAELLDWNRLIPSLAATALPGVVMLARPNKKLLFLPPAVSNPIIPGVEQMATAAIGTLAGPLRAAELLRARNVRDIDIIVAPIHIALRPAQPGPTLTAIEVPFRLLLSPNKHAAWKHAPSPVTHNGRTELWHTRLGVRSGDAVVEGVQPQRTLRAIWSRDHNINTPFNRPFLMSLDQDDRRQIVDLTSDFSLPVAPRPIGVQRFILSALGAWIDTEFGIEPPKGFSIEEWRHRGTMGRDHYVRVVYKGFLFPFGHRASLVKITERKIEHGPDGIPTAYLRQRMFIIVRERERLYPPPDNPNAFKSAGRETPLRRVRITTTVTPNLDPPQDSQLGAVVNPPMKAFWPAVAKVDFKFHLKAWDWEQREVDLLAPQAFVRADSNMVQALSDFNKTKVSRRAYATGGQLVALAETDASSLSRTSLETETLTFKALPPNAGNAEPPCYPQLEQAGVFMPPLRQIGGPKPATPVTIEKYIEAGFDATNNKAKVFAQVKGTAPSLDYAASGSADKAGGVATPSLAIQAVSRELGVVGDASDNFAKGNFDPGKFFPGNAKLLGGISLSDILASVTPSGFLGKTPALVTENTPAAVRTRLDWETTDLKPASVFRPNRQEKNGPTHSAKLVLHSELIAPKNSSPPTSSLSGVLTNFTIDFGEVIQVGFQQLSFTSVSGKKPDVHVVIGQDDVLFKGPLAFVQTIKDHLHISGFTDPPFLDITPAGVQVGYTLAIPTLAVGVFSLQNLALGARLMLPFTGEPIRLRFNVSERQHPFLVSVAPFGGGGFFALAVGVDGVEALELSVEFGGNVAIDLGVASGGVYVMAGIDIKIRLATPDASELTGYVRLGGSLQVLGIISISIEFYLGLTYSKPKAWGEAKVTVQVEVLMVKKSVTITARKEFAGGEGDPPFSELMPQPRWAVYAAAFA
jgi:hypothetical protein